jgi:predicted Fe-Mo cluster-binding NifX family protein
MIAIPLDEKTKTTISKLYGNAPYFALLDEITGNFSVIENAECGNGPKSADFLKSKGASKTIFYHMGEGVYNAFSKNGIEVFTCKHSRATLEEIYSAFDKFEKLDSTNYQELLDPGSSTCKCGCENS